MYVVSPDRSSKTFLTVFTLNLTQLVADLTHKKGHTLDLVWSFTLSAVITDTCDTLS